MPVLSRQLSAIMFTDIVGYTSMMEEDEDRAMQVLQQNRELQKPIIEKNEGTWLKEMGDGALAVFDNSNSAVTAAIAIQQSAAGMLKGKIRIGVHIAKVIVTENDVYGEGVNIASRLESIAEPGSIFISEAVQKSITQDSRNATRLLGEIRLKNIMGKINTYAIDAPNLIIPSEDKVRKLVGSKYGIQSLAVLPFDNLTGDPRREYFVAGIHDNLITALSRIGSLRVISKTSTLKYKNSVLSIPEIAKELVIDRVVEASVMRLNGIIRINVQLIKVFPEEKHIWAEVFDRPVANVYELFDEVTQSIAREINLNLTVAERSVIGHAKTVIPEAYDSYLRGIFHWEKLTAKDFELAIKQFERTIDIDPTFAPAYAGIVNILVSQAQMGLVDPQTAGQAIMENSQKALVLDEDSSDIHLMLALLKVTAKWNWEQAEHSFIKSINANENNALAHSFYGHLLIFLKRFDEAISEVNKGISLDPNNPLVNSLAGVVNYHAEYFEEAMALGLKAFDIDPNNILTFRLLDMCYFQAEELEKSFDIQKKIQASDPDSLNTMIEAYNSKDYYFAMQTLAESKERVFKSERVYVQPIGIAVAFIRANNFDKAMEWIEKGYEVHDQDMPYIFTLSEFKPLRSYKRFLDLEKEMNLSALTVSPEVG